MKDTRRQRGTTAATGGKSFRGFADFMREPQQVKQAVILALLMTVIGITFWTFYPFPFTFPDSGAYILTAQRDTFNLYRPMGYSSFISFVHTLGAGPGTLFTFSYVLSSLSILIMVFSAKYLLDIRKGWILMSMAVICILSPRIVFSANFLMSDGLFTSLTILFLSSAIWMVYTRSFWMALAHIALFAALFKVRFSGMFMLPVSIAAFWLSWGNLHKAGRALLALVPVMVFMFLYSSTKREYARHTGVETLSTFGGWQLINNATVLLPKAKEIDPKTLPADLRALHQFISMCPDTMFTRHRTMITDYMWNKEMPYKQFLFYYCDATGVSYPKGLVRTGKMYGEYATELIKRYPGHYFTDFIVPSLLSNFGCHQMSEEKTVFHNEPLYRDYFGLEPETYVSEWSFFTKIYPVRQALNWVYWLALLASAAWFCATQLRRGLPNPLKLTAAGLLLFFMLLYLGCSTIASPNTTWRYMMPMFVPGVVFIFWCISEISSQRRLRQDSAR